MTILLFIGNPWQLLYVCNALIFWLTFLNHALSLVERIRSAHGKASLHWSAHDTQNFNRIFLVKSLFFPESLIYITQHIIYLPWPAIKDSLLSAPITNNKHTSDKHTSTDSDFCHWVKFQELHNFHITFIVLGMQKSCRERTIHHCCITNFKAQVGSTFLWSWHD